MSRETIATNRIALLATGDEISHGDILNSNSQEIAQRLFNQGMQIGTHMATPDQISEIETAIHFLLQNHRALIITGGLGPTSDDLTRYALSKAIQRELIFDTSTWNNITARLKRFGYDTPPESNRQQALFPEGATIIPNPNGTAAGCFIEINNQYLFMLPGPPSECLPMVDSIVIPTLSKAQFPKIGYYRKWLLFGVSEGQIAEELDALAQSFDCVTGYRLWYPYIEFKLFSHHQHDFMTLVPLVEKTIQPYLIGNGQLIASELFKKTLISQPLAFHIHDTATGGLLESVIKTPETAAHLDFIAGSSADLHITIAGLQEFWQAQNVTQTQLEMQVTYLKESFLTKTTIPFRNTRVKQYAVEFLCWQFWKLLTKYGTVTR